ncbi:MAG TPA: heme-binding protein [Chitinophaga sp.]|uniref:GlcG/HbpS family heme-binding protein n=1 Tax=Chitinophaga sp. TaxID=1869181 RepID=UPI002C024825|nr:heme-binding protein [Chitinophaga sp.]HVI45885.1 heme-binding protein [Chitinophaga sp.]
MNITYKDAVKVLEAAVAKANALNIPVSISIVDNGGHLVSFARLDSVYGVVDFAMKKARTAAMFGVDSDVMGIIIADAELHAQGMTNANGGLLTIAGGVVIKNKEGKTIGAIGSSGGTPEQDREVAMAGVAAIA